MRHGRGYFGVAICNSKSEINVGTLWRSSFLYDAAFIATVGADTRSNPLTLPVRRIMFR